jgi:hypothetical protein
MLRKQRLVVALQINMLCSRAALRSHHDSPICVHVVCAVLCRESARECRKRKKQHVQSLQVYNIISVDIHARYYKCHQSRHVCR